MAEREPITGVWGSLQRDPRSEPLVDARGLKPNAFCLFHTKEGPKVKDLEYDCNVSQADCSSQP